MNPTANFRRQHEELMQLGMAILQRVRADNFADDAAGIRRELSRFTGKLMVHASMEGDALYPRLLAHGDQEARTLAQSFVDEVGGIYETYFAYAKRWPDANAIATNASTFARETKQVMRLLAERMMRETSELYPMVDALG
jgi:hypothetical protein